MAIKSISGAKEIPRHRLKGVGLKTNRITQKPNIIKTSNSSKVERVKGTVARGHVTKVTPLATISVASAAHETQNKKVHIAHLATEEDFEKYARVYHRIMDKTLYYYKKYHLQIQDEKPFTANELKTILTKRNPEGRQYVLKREFDREYQKLENFNNSIREKNFIDEEMLMGGPLELMIKFYNFRQKENNSGAVYVVRPELERFEKKSDAVNRVSDYYGLNDEWKHYLTVCTYTKEKTFNEYKSQWRR